ncbi:MAG: hypothetical protein K2F87_03130 [Muribaculaceae bacterium]|nr:hypothetical protein [Muribaculaceae bacterium]
MATFTLSHITDLVALKCGEFPDCRLSPSPGGAASSLRDMLTLLIAPTARHLTMEAPLERFTETVDFRRLLLSESDWGEEGFAELTLPADFCRIHSLRLPGWGSTLSESIPGDPLRVALGESAPPWMALRRTRPWMRLMKRGATHLLRFGPPVAALPDEAAYISLPTYDEDDEWISGMEPSLLPDLVDALTADLANMTGMTP